MGPWQAVLVIAWCKVALEAEGALRPAGLCGGCLCYASPGRHDTSVVLKKCLYSAPSRSSTVIEVEV